MTAAMRDGTGLGSFEAQFPERFFDVGIAEGHAVAMAAGMAKQGSLPIFAVYFSFLQRGYDMLLHDVAILGLHVVFGVDRAGLVGEDGETHHGLFDVAYLSSVPGMTLFAPASFAEVRSMLRHAVRKVSGPVALRYPRGGESGYRGDAGVEPTVCLKVGKAITLVTYGITTGSVLEAGAMLEAAGYVPEIIKLNRLMPLDDEEILASVKKTERVLIAEECAAMGGMGQQIAAHMAAQGVVPKAMALCNTGSGFITHGTTAELRRLCGLDAESLYQAAVEVLKRE